MSNSTDINNNSIKSSNSENKNTQSGSQSNECLTETCEPNCSTELNIFENPIDDEVLENTASILSAMADTARLSILLILDKGQELCVSEIAEILDDKVNTISMRLKKLYDAGLVSKRREAKHIYYRLKDEHVVTIIHNAIDHTRHHE